MGIASSQSVDPHREPNSEASCACKPVLGCRATRRAKARCAALRGLLREVEEAAGALPRSRVHRFVHVGPREWPPLGPRSPLQPIPSCASEDIALIVEPILGRPLSEISYGQVLIDIVRIGTRYEVRLPREMVLVAKQMLYFERYAKLMAPDWAILNDPELIGFLFEGLETHAVGEDARAASFSAKVAEPVDPVSG